MQTRGAYDTGSNFETKLTRLEEKPDHSARVEKVGGVAHGQHARRSGQGSRHGTGNEGDLAAAGGLDALNRGGRYSRSPASVK